MTQCQARIMVGIFFISLALNLPADAGPSIAQQYKPTWSLGQRWKVEVERTTEAKAVPKNQSDHFKPKKYRIVYQFEVESSRDIGGELCVSIRIQCIGLDGAGATEDSFYRVFIRQSDQTLKEAQRLNKKSEAIEASRTFETGPVDATDWVGFLPLAFPTFQEGQTGQEPPVRTSKKGKVEFKSSDRCRQTEEVTRIRTGGKETDALKVILEKKNDDGPPRRTTETWVQGMPWWTEATHDRDGRQWCSARLLKD